MKKKAIQFNISAESLAEFKRVRKGLCFRPVVVCLWKNVFDDSGAKVSESALIPFYKIQFKQLVKLLKELPFIALDSYPHSSSDPANSFRLVKATTGPTRMNTILCEFVLTFHGDPKYWKWALVASGLVKK